MRVPSARTERPTMRSGAPFGPEWVKGGCRRQADGTAGLPPAPEMPCAPRAVTLGANSGPHAAVHLVRRGTATSAFASGPSAVRDLKAARAAAHFRDRA